MFDFSFNHTQWNVPRTRRNTETSRQELWTQLGVRASYKQDSRAKTNFQNIHYPQSNFQCYSKANMFVWTTITQGRPFPAAVLQNFCHSFHATPKSSIYQKLHPSFPMFVVTYNQDLLPRFTPNLHWFQWRLVWQMMMTYLINTKGGIGNVSYQQAFNLQFIGFISPTPALIWEHFILVKELS